MFCLQYVLEHYMVLDVYSSVGLNWGRGWGHFMHEIENQ